MDTPKCIDLDAAFGKKYRVTCEESYFSQYGAKARKGDPWLMIIKCQYGHIFPHGGSVLAASVDGYPRVASKLAELDYCTVHQEGDGGELTVLFDVGDFAKIARIMRPRRKRQVSESQRDRLRQIGFRRRAEVSGCTTA